MLLESRKICRSFVKVKQIKAGVGGKKKKANQSRHCSTPPTISSTPCFPTIHEEFMVINIQSADKKRNTCSKTFC